MHTLFTIFALLIATTSAVSKRHGYGHSHGHGHGHELRHLSAYETNRHVDSVEEATARCLGLQSNEDCDEANGQHDCHAYPYMGGSLTTATDSRLDRESYGETSAKTAPLDIKAVPGHPDAYGRPDERTAVSDVNPEIARIDTEFRSPLSTADKFVTTKPTPSKSPSEPTLDAYSVTNFFPYSPSGFRSPSPHSLPELRDLEYRANELPSPYGTLQHRANDIPSLYATLHQRAEKPTPYHNMLPRSANVTLPSPSTPTQQNSNATTPALAPTQQNKNGTASASRTSTSQDSQNTGEAAPTHGDLFQKPNAAPGMKGVGWGIAGAALIAAGFAF